MERYKVYIGNDDRLRVIVYNSKNNIFVDGMWREILEEFYSKLPIIVEKTKKKERLIKMGESFYKDVLKKIYYSCSINDHIDIVKDSIEHNYNEYLSDRYRIYCNGETVFICEYNLLDGISILRYNPGNWEREITEYLRNQETEKKNKEYIEDLSELRKLRSL